MVRSADQHDWGDPIKVDARDKSIIGAYRSLTGRQSIPRGRQYWTMCGKVGSEGQLIPNCELDQVVKSGLVSWSQVYGVEINQRVHAQNVQACRSYGPTLIHGDLLNALDQHLGEKKLCPAIVNIDTFLEVKKGVDMLARAMDILNFVDGPIMVAWNIILSQEWYGRSATVREVADVLHSNGLFSLASRHGWKESDTYYPYIRKRAKMGTFIFCRQGRARVLSKCG